MARSEIHNVAYFPFYCKESKKQFIIERKYGNNGYAVWIKLLRELAISNDHYIQLQDQIEIAYIASKFLIDETLLIEILDFFCKIKIIDESLWLDYNVIFSEELTTSLAEAYKRRSNIIADKESICKHLESICKHLSGKCMHNAIKLDEFVDICTQSKVNKSKVNKSKLDIPLFKHWITDFIEAEKLTELQNKKFSLTYEQCLNLETKYLAQSIRDKLIACTIKPSYTAKITSLSRLLQNWLNKPEHIKQIGIKTRGGALVKSPELFESLEYQQLTD